MKLKPLYLYGTVAVVAAFILVFYLFQDNTVKPVNASSDIMNKEMPKDEIHKGLQNSNTEAPSSGNVMNKVKHEMAMLKKAVEKNPNDTLSVRQYADFLAVAHQKDEAIKYYKEILQKYPDRTDIKFSMSYAYFVNHDFENAEKMMNDVIQKDNKNVAAYYNLGVIAASKGNKQKAKEAWQKLIKINPGCREADLANSALKKL